MTATAGLGLKLDHLDEALACEDAGLWFEVHAENYMVEGGPRLAALDAVRTRFPVSLHGVGLSLLSIEGPDPEHLRRFRRLVDRIDPFRVSDHLAWQRWDGTHHSDFLPFPRTAMALDLAVANVSRAQEALGRRMLVENPSLYIDLPGHEMDENVFLSELARRSGCGLLLDVNNLFLSAANLGVNAEARLEAFPGEYVDEIHLAGHSQDAGGVLLIDTHDQPVSDKVWRLYGRALQMFGPRPTLIERDDNIPPFAELMSERSAAHELLTTAALLESADA
jgi:uncharacterized protein (UPF0276 family)